MVIHNEHRKRFKGEVVKKQYLRIVIALIGFVSLGITARAQTVDQVVVNIPFEFVVAGKTLPAGKLSGESRVRYQLASPGPQQL